MIEHYFRAGVRFLWNKPPDANGPLNGAIVGSLGMTTPMTYDGLDGHPALLDPIFLGIHVANVLGLAKGANVPYAWLDYAPGRIARLPIGVNDILSGYMSGCLIARGTYNGAMSAFHVGTIDNNPGVNRTVKQAFAQALPADATGFYPAAAWPPGEVALIQNRLDGTGDAGHIFALMTSAGAFYSILMFNVLENSQWTNPAGRRYWCVGGIKAVAALNRVRLMASLLQ